MKLSAFEFKSAWFQSWYPQNYGDKFSLTMLVSYIVLDYVPQAKAQSPSMITWLLLYIGNGGLHDDISNWGLMMGMPLSNVPIFSPGSSGTPPRFSRLMSKKEMWQLKADHTYWHGVWIEGPGDKKCRQASRTQKKCRNWSSLRTPKKTTVQLMPQY